MTKPILVTSAAGGTQGRTGRHVSEMLLERGARVRAFVRQIDERSDRLKSLGAEIFVGDFLDARSVEQAARDVSAIYFAYPVQDGLADATAAMAFAARTHGVSRLVNLVMYQSSIDAPTPRMRQNFLSEQVAEDVARIAVGLLTGPALTAGAAFPVIGSAISIKQIVGAFARVLDRDIHYEEITDEQWRSEVLARGWNAHAVEHLSSLWKSLRAASLSAEAARFAVTDTIEKIGGAKPKTFEQFVREQQPELAAQLAAARAQASSGGRS